MTALVAVRAAVTNHISSLFCSLELLRNENILSFPSTPQWVGTHHLQYCKCISLDDYVMTVRVGVINHLSSFFCSLDLLTNESILLFSMLSRPVTGSLAAPVIQVRSRLLTWPKVCTHFNNQAVAIVFVILQILTYIFAWFVVFESQIIYILPLF